MIPFLGPTLVGLPTVVVVGVAAVAAGLLVGGYLLVSPAPFRVSLARRRPGAERPHLLSRAVDVGSVVIDRVLRTSRDADVHVAVLERAGVRTRLQDFGVVLVAAAAVVGLAGAVLVTPAVGVLLALAVFVVVRLVLGLMASRRQRAFANQLDDSLQLMSSSLRAGHSLMQALTSVSQDTEEPTSVEFSRIVNEARVGRELGLALEETAARMASDDFVWVTQAIAINREAGGNLAEVLDRVGQTIRERNQIRRQVQSLSAEGKLSAYILIALPLGIAGFLSITNPSYMAKFTHSLTGYALISSALVLLVVGALWLRRVVRFTF